jgi:hypothetical protein
MKIVAYIIILIIKTNFIFSQIEFKINEIKISDIIEVLEETIDDELIIDEYFGYGPKIKIECIIKNNTEDTIFLEPSQESFNSIYGFSNLFYELSLLFNYSGKEYVKEITGSFNDPFVEFWNNKIIIMPYSSYSFNFRTSYLFGNYDINFRKEYETKRQRIVDCTKEVIETLPTLKVRYKDKNIDITTNEILKVTVDDFIFNYDDFKKNDK